MKILVLGGAGMAGHVIAITLRECGHDVDTVSARHKLDDNTILIDALDGKAILHHIDAGQYDAVVNCIGILVKQSTERKDLSSYLNSYLPHMLEQHLSNTSIRLIHLSTDCVFSGYNAPYREGSLYDGDSFYDRTKALGEVINDKDLTFRMSIIGPELRQEGIGLFNWFMQQSGEINGYSKAIWNGVTTIELAKAVNQALDQQVTGLYHLVPSSSISKYELLKLLKQSFDRSDITISPSDAVTLDKTLINSRKDFAFKVSDYSTMAKHMREWIISHRALYPHYVDYV